MSAIGTLAVKHLKRGWKQTLQVILVYLLCTCFFIAEGMTVSSYLQSTEIEKMDTFGAQSGFLSGCTAETIKTLRQSASVQKAGVIRSVAVHTIPDAVYGNQIIAGTADETARSLCHIRTADGRLPEKIDEIALEHSAIARLREEITVGDRLELTFQTADGQKDQRAFTVVGILADFSSLQVPGEATVTLPNALVSEAYRAAQGSRFYQRGSAALLYHAGLDPACAGALDRGCAGRSDGSYPSSIFRRVCPIFLESHSHFWLRRGDFFSGVLLYCIWDVQRCQNFACRAVSRRRESKSIRTENLLLHKQAVFALGREGYFAQ